MKITIFILSLSILFIIFFFAYIYKRFTDFRDWNGISYDAEYLTYIYFSTSTISTIGYGDIYPKSKKAKLLVTIHQLLVIFIVIIIPLSLFYSRCD